MDQLSLEQRVIELEKQVESLTCELSKKNDEIAKMHYVDSLTGINNRNKLQDDIKNSGYKAIMVMDIDKFGQVNAVYGSDVADYVLAEVANMLQINKPNNAELYRYAGDQFVFVIENPTKNQAELLADQILSFAAMTHIYHEDIEIKIGFTIGIDYGEGSLELISHAIIALNDSKTKGVNSYARFSPNLEILKMQESNLYWIPRVRNAIEKEAVRPWFQPIVNNKTGKVERYECLARLKDEAGNIVDPYYFLQAAEVSGILTSITKAIITHSFDYFENSGVKFSINITDNDLQEGYLEEYLKHKLTKHNLKPKQITLEIVESVTASEASSQTDQLLRLKKMGFLIAADDFGAEHSNFSRLLSIDLDMIKIDGRFVRNLEHDGRSQAIVKNIVQFSNSIGAQTVAEFVGTPEVYDIVKSIGVDYSQGFFLGKPAPTI